MNLSLKFLCVTFSPFFHCMSTLYIIIIRISFWNAYSCDYDYAKFLAIMNVHILAIMEHNPQHPTKHYNHNDGNQSIYPFYLHKYKHFYFMFKTITDRSILKRWVGCSFVLFSYCGRGEHWVHYMEMDMVATFMST